MRYFVIALLMFLLVLPVVAQEDDTNTCDIDVIEAISLLTQAQIAANAGDVSAAQATLENAQTVLDTLTSNCGVSTVDQSSPEGVADALFAGLFSGDVDMVANLVCQEQRAAAVEALDTLGEDTEGVEIDTSGLEFEATEDGDTATVAVSGELSLSIEIEGETIEQSADVSELGGELTELPMIREDGNWVFCPMGENAFGG